MNNQPTLTPRSKANATRWTSIALALVLGFSLGFSLVPGAEGPEVHPDGDLPLAGDDPVVMSFVRDLNREATPTARIRREAIEHDELYEMFNTIRRTADEQQGQPVPEQTQENDDDE